MRLVFLRAKVRVALFVLAALIGFRVYLPSLVKNYANRELNRDPQYRGEIQKVKLHLWRGAYTGYGLKIERIQGQHAYPLLNVSKVTVGIGWKEIFRGAVVAQITAEDFQVNLVKERDVSEGKGKVLVSQVKPEGREHKPRR